MIEIKNICKSFEEITILKDISFNILEKESLAIMGASGSGKTTLINIIAGLLKQDSGKLIGVPENISMVFQENRLLNEFTAFDNIALICDVIKESIIENFKALGLEDSMYKTITELSGGMKRRVALMRALLAKSDLIILDEPFKGLDEDRKKQVISYTKSLIENKTCILVSHDINEVKALNCNRIINI